MDSREKIWAEAFNAALSGGRGADIAKDDAEKALAIYERRWPADRTNEERVSMTGMDAGMLLRAISQLEADHRYDALLVLKALYSALRDSQQRGERLAVWNPPARGS